jgi:hypothetical protein
LYQGAPSGAPDSSLKLCSFSRGLDIMQKASDQPMRRAAAKADITEARYGTPEGVP